MELTNPIKLNIKRFYFSQYISGGSLKATDEYMYDGYAPSDNNVNISAKAVSTKAFTPVFDVGDPTPASDIYDNDGQMVYRKYKFSAAFKRSDLPVNDYLLDSVNCPIFFDVFRFIKPSNYDNFFITNIKATQMYFDSGSCRNDTSRYAINRFKDISNEIDIAIREFDELEESAYGETGGYLSLCVTGDIQGSVYLEFDVWLPYSDDLRTVMSDSGVWKCIYDKDTGESSYAISNKDDNSAVEYHNDDIFNNTSIIEYKIRPKIRITITSYNAQKTYDGTPLTNHNYHIDYEQNDETDADLNRIIINFTGSQTDAGSSNNTFSIDWNGVNSEKYDVTTTYGTLTVSAPPSGGAPSAPPAPMP